MSVAEITREMRHGTEDAGMATAALGTVAPGVELSSATSAAQLKHAVLPDILFRGDVTLPQLLRYRAQLHGEELALREKNRGVWQRYSWQHYYRTARRVAHGLRALGLRADDRVAIASEDTPEWYYADLGAQTLGASVVGVYPTNPWSELQYIVNHCGARIVVTGDQEQTDKVLEALASDVGLPKVEQIICVDMRGMRGYPRDKIMSFEELLELGDRHLQGHPRADVELDAVIDAGKPDNCCILVYTSGTTGPPKGAMLSHRNLVYLAYVYAEASDPGGRDFEAVCYLPLCHVAERCMSMVLQLVMGGRVNFAETIDTVASDVRELAPIYFIGVPRIYEKLQRSFLFKLDESGLLQRWVYRRVMDLGRTLSERREAAAGVAGLRDQLLFWLLYWLMFRNIQRYMGLNRSRQRLCAGAAVSPELMRFYDIIGLPVSQGYGLTECAGVVFLQRPGFRRAGGAGVPLRGVEWRLTDEGEIQLRCRSNFLGYYRDPEATAKVLSADGWLSSGDIVEIMDNGEITVVDRKKAIIITSGGKNIAPSEIENALKDSPYIGEAIVVGEARNFLGALIQINFDTVGRWARERGLAYTTFKSLTQLPEVRAMVEHIVAGVNTRFARVENIRRFALLEKELDHDDGELTATQKVRRSAINAKFAKELAEIYGE